MHKTLTVKDLMSLSPAEKRRRVRALAKSGHPSSPPKKPEPAEQPHPSLKRWIKPEKPIEIIG